ncbi:SDR family oxidoreductase [Piscinibacter sakaiensis]|uniref:Short chain dehydrogenase n=1 Tax=Piscinibacter sakaiensis TaxID=1547922 RepID=A0A0K8NUI3_PISS1|nr:SDR family oxidoreductase [Piscinibacter sakaiensis]GAP34052.1 short chain dehydrogenase [Piscinibacter sakaiensis]
MPVLELLQPRPRLRVLVTAGAAGIGAAMARAFVEAGARVHVCDIDRAALDRLGAAQPGITTSMADAAVSADVDAVFDDVQALLGGLDVLVSNAGIAGPTGPIEDISLAAWERTIAVNLTGQYLFARRAVPLLKRSAGDPCVIAIGSAASRLGWAFRSPYAASKWAVVGLVKSLALELGAQGVRVNAILPGSLEGERLDGAVVARAAATGTGADALSARSPQGAVPRRLVGAEDVAAMALFLCSPAARHFTGQAISVGGPVELP